MRQQVGKLAICICGCTAFSVVLTASDYSATAPDAQSTTARDYIGSVHFHLVKPAAAPPGKKLQERLEPSKWRSVESRETYYHRRGESGLAFQPRWSCDSGVGDMERERTRLFVRNQ